jgi:signal transduction histidine kinase/CheY-like chemotaxis protein
VRNIQLRTKFLLSLLAISAGLTTATLLIVRDSVRRQVRGAIKEDLRNSVSTYQSFERQRQAAATQSARLIANLPYLRALMTTRDTATIVDGSKDIWGLSGTDLLVLADRVGKVVAVRANTSGFAAEEAQEKLRHLLSKEGSSDWWFGGGHLYEVWVQPIYFGAASNDTTIGYLAIGDEIDERAARNFSNVASSEVAFHFADDLVASTFTSSEKAEFERRSHGTPQNSLADHQEIELRSEQYLMTSVRLSKQGEPEVSLTVLKSFDKASAFLERLNRVLLGLGVVSVLAGSVVAFLISNSFMRPLASLVSGVRALERGDFSYPLESRGGDEVAEVTHAFGKMRATLETVQNDQKLLEGRLRQAHKMEAVGRLAGGVAHDFNNLLTIIRGHGDLLLDRGVENAAQRNSIEQIQKAANRAVSMTRQLLAFSRMQVLQPRVLDLNSIVADMGKMLPRLIGEHIEYVFVPEPKLAQVKADPGQIEQVIMNLAVNARDAMSGGGRLLVQTRNVVLGDADARKRPPMSSGAYVLLSVSDTGHGMDEATKAHIFEPFFTTKEVGKGTGLGLATVYGVVKQSGGFIWVESSEGQGATFEIYLPQVAEKATQPEKETKPPVLQRGTETILVVEDEAGVRELAAEFLRASGYSVLEARDGLEALEIAKRYTGPIHMILSDMVMPRMSGAELAARAAAIQPGARIVLMSGYSEHSSNHQNQQNARYPILQKPFSLSSLVGKVHEVLAENLVAMPSEVTGARAPDRR